MDPAPDKSPESASRRPAVLSASEVRETAELARILISDAELEPLGRELSAILDYAALLAEVDVEGVPPTTHVGQRRCPLRADAVGDHDSPAEALARAPARESALFSVPAIFAAAPDAAGGAHDPAEHGEG